MYKKHEIIISPRYLHYVSDADGVDSEKVIENLLEIFEITSFIFTTFIKRVTESESLKIYNDQQDIRLLFIEFTKSITADYNTKMYKKWIEISLKPKN